MGHPLIRTNILSQGIDYAMMISNLDTEDKAHFIKHFLIDLRSLLLKPKIEEAIGMYGQGSDRTRLVQHKTDGLTFFAYANFMQVLNEHYGEEIEA